MNDRTGEKHENTGEERHGVGLNHGQWAGDERKAFGKALTFGGVLYSAIAAAIVVAVSGWSIGFIGLAIAVIFASATCGLLVGFTFGVPRSASYETVDNSRNPIAMNTNYSRVSDWLTTIIVGLSLVQFDRVLDGLGWLADQSRAMFNNNNAALTSDGAAAFGLSMMIGTFGVAFLLMYMWTSTRLLQIYAMSQEQGLRRQSFLAANSRRT